MKAKAGSREKDVLPFVTDFNKLPMHATRVALGARLCAVVVSAKLGVIVDKRGNCALVRFTAVAATSKKKDKKKKAARANKKSGRFPAAIESPVSGGFCAEKRRCMQVPKPADKDDVWEDVSIDHMRMPAALLKFCLKSAKREGTMAGAIPKVGSNPVIVFNK